MSLHKGGINASRANRRKKITPPSNSELSNRIVSRAGGKRSRMESAARIVKRTK
jgi:hypothetical protein